MLNAMAALITVLLVVSGCTLCLGNDNSSVDYTTIRVDIDPAILTVNASYYSGSPLHSAPDNSSSVPAVEESRHRVSDQVNSYQDDSPVAWHFLQEIFKNVEPLVQNASVECQRDTLLFLEHLSNFTLWAVQMYDASVKIPSGVLSGDNQQLGHFDQCLGVQGPPVQAQYCLADVVIEPDHQTYPSFHRKPADYVNPFSLEYEMLSSAWEKLIVPLDPSKRRRNHFRWAVCVPRSCSSDEVGRTLQNGLAELAATAAVRVNVTMPPHACTHREDKPWTNGEIVMCTILYISLAVMLLTSAYDMLVYQKRTDKETPPTKTVSLVISFSFYTNMVRLFRPDSTDEMSVMHGMRVYTMCLVMLGHRCLHSYGGPFLNPEFLEERYRKIQDMFLLNGTLITDTFFMLSGFLTCYSLLLEVAKRRLNLPVVFLYRWMRITPVYMMVVGIYATILIRLGDGPVWDEKVAREVSRCQDNWWLNLLYLNNYINVDRLCMFQSWYIACDMHYFIMATFTVLICAKLKKLLMPILGFLLFLSIAIPFTITYVGRYDAVLKVYMSLLVDPSSNEFFNWIYITSHNRAGPYIIGMISAYLYIYMKKRNFEFSQWAIWTGSISATVLALGSMFGAWPFYFPGREYYAFESALYAGLHRVVWSVAMSWVVLAGCTTGFGMLHPILGLKALTPLSRLTYCAFLCHGIIQLYTVSSVRIPMYMSFPRLFWMVMGDIIMSFILALIIHLLFEAPVSGIQKLMLRPARHVERKSKEEQRTEMAHIQNNNEGVINMNQNAEGVDHRPNRF